MLGVRAGTVTGRLLGGCFTSISFGSSLEVPTVLWGWPESSDCTHHTQPSAHTSRPSQPYSPGPPLPPHTSPGQVGTPLFLNIKTRLSPTVAELGQEGSAEGRRNRPGSRAMWLWDSLDPL